MNIGFLAETELQQGGTEMEVVIESSNGECEGCKLEKLATDAVEEIKAREKWLADLVEQHDFSQIDNGDFIETIKWFAAPATHHAPSDDVIYKLAQSGMEI